MLSEQEQELKDFIKSVIDEELENYFNSNLSEESGGSYSKNTAGNKDNIARKRHKREYEKKNGKCPAGQELHHVDGLSSSKVRCEPVSKNRGRKGEGGRKKGKKKRDPARGRKTQDSLSEQRVAQGISKIRNFIGKAFDKADEKLKDDYCQKTIPDFLRTGGSDTPATFGQLQAMLKCSLEYADRKKFLDIITNFVPGVAAAKEIFATSDEVSEFVLGMYQLPDNERPQGNLGKLDMDDTVSDIISDKVEKEFVKWLISSIENEDNFDKPIPDDWDITDQLRDFLKGNKDGRTITGYENED